MSKVATVHRAQSSVEAEAIRGWLAEQGIECRIDDPRDTAYPGIVDRGGRWNLLVAAADEDAAREAIDAWNDAEIAGGAGPYRGDAGPQEPLSGPTPSQLARRSLGKRFALGAVLLTSLCANFYLYLTNYALERDYIEQLNAFDALDARNERLSARDAQSAELETALEREQGQLQRCRVALDRTTQRAESR